MRLALATGCSFCLRGQRESSTLSRFARRAVYVAKPRSLSSRQRLRDGLLGSETPDSQSWGVVLRKTAVELAMKRPIGTAVLVLAVTVVAAAAQDMMRNLDLSSPDMVSAEMTRADVEAALGAAAPTGKKLSGLDLSGLDLSGVNFRAARLNKTKLAGAKLDHAILDQAWLLDADLTGADLRGASLFASQMGRARLDGADLSGARVAADLTRASLVGASIADAHLGADMRNQSMGLMRAVLKSAKLDRINARGADLSRVDLEFASMKGA